MCRIEWWAIPWHLGTGENFSGGVVSGMCPGWSMGPKDCIRPVWGVSASVHWNHLDVVYWGGSLAPLRHEESQALGWHLVSLCRNSPEVVQMQSQTLKSSQQGQQPVHGWTQSGRSRSPQDPWVSVRSTAV